MIYYIFHCHKESKKKFDLWYSTCYVREVISYSASTEDEDGESCGSTVKTSSMIRNEWYSETFRTKLPPVTGTEHTTNLSQKSFMLL